MADTSYVPSQIKSLVDAMGDRPSARPIPLRSTVPLHFREPVKQQKKVNNRPFIPRYVNHVFSLIASVPLAIALGFKWISDRIMWCDYGFSVLYFKASRIGKAKPPESQGCNGCSRKKAG